MRADQTIVRRLRIRSGAPQRGAGAPRAALSALGDLTQSLAPSAVVCIRRLHDPLPRRGGLSIGGSRPSAEWEAALRAKVTDMAAHAVRPADGPVPASANVIAFADRAEMLACLGRDWCAGTMSAQWWWQSLFPGIDAAAGIIKALKENPRSIPAALEHLSRSGHLESFVARLESGLAAQLAVDVAATFQATELATRTTALVAQPRARVEQSIVPAAVDRRSISPARHSAVTPAALSTVDPLSVALDRYVPELADSTSSNEGRALIAVALLLHRATPHRVAAIIREQPAKSIGVPAPGSGARAASVTDADRDSGELDTMVAHVAVPESNVDQGEDVGTTSPFVADPVEKVAAASVDAPAFSSLAAVQPAGDRLVIDSNFAGTFYLVNVAIALGYYGDFTQPLARGIDVPIWIFLSRIARLLVGVDAFDADPIEPLFTRLAGEDAQVTREQERWCQSHVDDVRERLGQGLDVDALVAGPLVVQRAGRVRLSADEIDVRFDLAALPIEIRMSGLDRDPGFVPAAGRAITFSYV